MMSRVLAIGFLGACAAATLGTSGTALAAPLVCDATGTGQVNRVVGDGSCGARAENRSTAHAEDRSGAGSAVASARGAGHANAYNTVPGGTALAGANTGGTSYAVTVGPGGLSLAQARAGGTSIAVGGVGGRSYAGQGGVRCAGGAAAAYDSTSGTYCFGTGRTYFTNKR